MADDPMTDPVVAPVVAPVVDPVVQIVIYREGDGFVAQCLNVDVASEGSTVDEARSNLREALELFFETPAAHRELTPVAEAHLEQLTLKSA